MLEVNCNTCLLAFGLIRKSPLEISIVNPLNLSDWDDYIRTLEKPSFFLSRNWIETLCKAYNYKPCYLFAKDNKKVLAVIPIVEVKSWLTGKRGVSLPFTDQCEPVFTNGLNPKIFMDRIFRLGEESGWRYFEIRGGQEVWSDATPSTYFYEYILDLVPDLERLKSGFRNSTKRNIRKATRKGVECRVSESLHSVEEFYRLNCITRKSHGLPPQPFSFFRSIYDCVLSRGMGIVVLARYKGTPTTSSVLLKIVTII